MEEQAPRGCTPLRFVPSRAGLSIMRAAGAAKLRARRIGGACRRSSPSSCVVRAAAAGAGRAADRKYIITVIVGCAASLRSACPQRTSVPLARPITGNYVQSARPANHRANTRRGVFTRSFAVPSLRAFKVSPSFGVRLRLRLFKAPPAPARQSAFSRRPALALGLPWQSLASSLQCLPDSRPQAARCLHSPDFIPRMPASGGRAQPGRAHARRRRNQFIDSVTVISQPQCTKTIRTKQQPGAADTSHPRHLSQPITREAPRTPAPAADVERDRRAGPRLSQQPATR